MSAKNVATARQKRKQELVYIMGGKCVLCGYDKCIAALEFHHIDKSQKNDNFQVAIVTAGKKMLMKLKSVL